MSIQEVKGDTEWLEFKYNLIGHYGIGTWIITTNKTLQVYIYIYIYIYIFFSIYIKEHLITKYYGYYLK